MSGRHLNDRKTERGFFLAVPAALELMIIFALLLTAAAVYVCHTGTRVFYDYELSHVRGMIENSVDTAAQQVWLTGVRAQREEKPLDLEPFLTGTEEDAQGGRGFRFAALSPGKETELEKGIRETGLSFQYLLLRGDGRVLCIDTGDGEVRELGADDRICRLARESLNGGQSLLWNGEGQVLSMRPADFPVVFGGKMLLYNPAGSGIGIIGSADLSSIRSDCARRAGRSVGALFGIVGVILVFLCFAVHRSLRVFRSMQRVMAAFRKGEDLHGDFTESIRREQEGKKDDFAELSGMICVMADSLMDYRDTVDTIRRRYEPFVPEAILGLFGKEKLLDVAPGDTAEVRGVLLNAVFEPSAEGREGAGRCSDSPQYAAACEIITGKGGIVTAFADRSLTALFTGDGAASASEAEELIRALKLEENGVREIRLSREEGCFRFRVDGCPGRMAIRMEKTEGVANARVGLPEAGA